MNRHTHTHPHTHTHTHTHTHKCMFTSVLSTNVCHNANRTSVIYVLTGQKATTSIWMMIYLYRCLRIFMIMCLYWLFSTDDLSMKTSWVQSHLFLFTTFDWVSFFHFGTCVADGWYKQPHLAPVRLMRLWGPVRLQTCGAIGDQGTQDKQATTTQDASSHVPCLPAPSNQSLPTQTPHRPNCVVLF